MQRATVEQRAEGIGLLVVEFENLGDVIAARDALRAAHQDEDRGSLAYLDDIVATEYFGIGHRWPLPVVGQEAATVLSAELRLIGEGQQLGHTALELLADPNAEAMAIAA